MRPDHNPAAGTMLIVTDPRRHGDIRRIIGSAFTPRMVRRLEETVRAVVVESIEGLREQGGGGFVEMAARLPVAVICDMPGAPREDWASRRSGR
ncbi:hypothetical protein [Kitasatospora sp. NPDC101183]|uniref:hypothetical protein n=1 Tax=Kitasatospora sp. NPDC101183 TaxID=3364100 RepID=UPI0037F19313